MYFVSEKEKLEDLSRTLRAIFGDGKKASGTTGQVSGADQNGSRPELKIPEGLTPIPAKKQTIINLDDINNEADIVRIFGRK